MKARNAEPVTSGPTTAERCSRNFRDYRSVVQVAMLTIIMGSLRRTVQQTAKTVMIRRTGRLQGLITIRLLSGSTGNMSMFRARNAINLITRDQ
jgi:hypothetical protein